jgi:ectoine hydroxylase-related dioxygenase (phytanoyl-CoA dioxygenase family)
LLVSFPDSKEPWDVPHQAWHLDYPVLRGTPSPAGIRIFICLAKLEPGGGGTAFIASSPRLVRDVAVRRGFHKTSSADARKALIRTYPWMKALCSSEGKIDRIEAFMNKSESVDGVDLRVVEMTGEAGDVFLTDPLMLHAPAHNCRTTPRMVLSAAVWRAGFDPGVFYR